MSAATQAEAEGVQYHEHGPTGRYRTRPNPHGHGYVADRVDAEGKTRYVGVGFGMSREAAVRKDIDNHFSVD